MRKKEIILVAVLLALCLLYARYFTRWFVKPQIVIRVSQRPDPRQPNADTEPLFFILNDKFRLTSIEVIPFDGETFHPLDRPVWHLVSDSNSSPVKVFRYGQHIPGMKPALANVRPDPLTPGEGYRLLLSAGKASGWINFRPKDP
jgi:hypothetical protein